MEAARVLHVVPQDPVEGFDGELTQDNLRLLLQRINGLTQDLREAQAEIAVRVRHEQMQDRDLKGKRLRIAELEADREAEAEDHPLRPQVDAVHACWKAINGKRRPLHFSDVFSIAAAVHKLGFDTCLRAVVGNHFDPYTRRQRNGKVSRYTDLETIFKTYGRVSDYAGRAPESWTPDAEKVAAIAEVPTERVREWLGVAA